MRRLFRTILKLAPVVTLLWVSSLSIAQAQNAKLQLDQLDVLASRAKDTVDVKLDEHTLQITSRFFGKDPDEAEIKELLKSVKGIYVKSFEFEKENAYTPAEVEFVTAQLRAPGWNKIVGILSKKDSENVDVYLMTVGEQVHGLAVVSIEPKEFTVVNIVGPIDLEKLRQLDGSFGINLNLPAKKKKPDDQ
jgi:hypothetical protein